MLIDVDKNTNSINSNSSNTTTSTTNRDFILESDLISSSLLSSSSTAATVSNFIRMERPKSAKHNIERLRKSAYLSKLNLINSRHFNNNSTNGVYSTSKQQDDSNEQVDNLDDYDDYENIAAIKRKEQRMIASKSAYITGMSIAKQRPQSARHNLDKYRNDIRIEKQKKIDLIQQFYQQQQLNDIDISKTELEKIESILPDDNDDDDDDIDNLDGLLIREEDDSQSETETVANNNDYIDSKSNQQALIHNKSTKHIKTNKSKIKNTKLLSRRIIDTKENQTNPQIPSQMRLYRENTFTNLNTNNQMNKTTVPALNTNNNNNNNDQSTNTFIHTANPLSQHSTNHNNLNDIKSILIQQQQQQQQQQRPTISSSMSNYTNNLTRPLSGSTNNIEIKHNLIATNTNNLNTIDLVANNSSSSSTCSSTSSSITASSKQNTNQSQSIHLNQLAASTTKTTTTTTNMNEKQINNKNKNSLLSQELLNEWYKNDDEVDLHIEPTSQQDYDSTDYIEFDNTQNKTLTFSSSSSPHKQLQQRNAKSNLQKQSIILALNAAGRSSRFSDYSSCSNKTSMSNLTQTNNINNVNNNNINKPNRQNSYLSRERTNNSMDPWTKRNPTLVAQNVLIKHRAELEQLAARHTSNSRASNHSSLLTTTNANQQNTNKFLLPDAKYFKKNNF